jgi:hypothetical protein
MRQALEQAVRRTAADRCEYCFIPEMALQLKHVLDHIVARQHGGKSELDNLALCCGRCNQSKGPNIAGNDPNTGKLTRLFNPRADTWSQHFRYENGILVGLTDVGRTTVNVLAINRPLRVAVRQSLIEIGIKFESQI